MKLFKILTDNNHILRKKSTKVNFLDWPQKKLKKLICDMEYTMIKNYGIGLAAPQIGKNVRIIIINLKDGPIYMINPLIIKKSFLKEWGEEGCLSVPGFFGEVKRNKEILCEYQDVYNNTHHLKVQGLMARVIQHEIDHLDGVLFTDKAKNIKKIISKENEKN